MFLCKMSIVRAESLNDTFSYFAGTEVKLTNVLSKRHHPIIICKMSIVHSLVYNFKNIQNEVMLHCKGNIQKWKHVNFAASDTKPSDPPLSVQFCGKKLTPFFFWKWMYDCQNEFYTWSHWKIYIFSSVIMLYFSINSPFRRACRCHFQSCFNSCIYAQNTPDQV